MILRHGNEVEREIVPGGTSAEKQVLIGSDEAPRFSMRRFIMQPGGGMPYHTNTVEHEQFVLRGQARIRVDGERYTVSAGDVVYIPAGVPHEYHVEGSEPFEFLCMVPNEPDEVQIVS